MVGILEELPNLAAPLTWSSDVMRDTPNLGTTMVSVPARSLADSRKPGCDQADTWNSVSAPMSLAVYLSSFGTDDPFGTDDQEVERLALSTADLLAKDDHESLDSFFAEVFGT